LVADFVKRCPIEKNLIEKLRKMIQLQIDGLLDKIEEDPENLSPDVMQKQDTQTLAPV
jgi:hypothetical protein